MVVGQATNKGGDFAKGGQFAKTAIQSPSRLSRDGRHINRSLSKGNHT
jgi:hypothetical protein